MCFAAFSIATRVRARDSVGRIVHFVGAAACDYCRYRRIGRCCCSSFARRWAALRRWAVGSGLCVEHTAGREAKVGQWVGGATVLWASLFPKKEESVANLSGMRMSVDLQHTRKVNGSWSVVGVQG